MKSRVILSAIAILVILATALSTCLPPPSAAPRSDTPAPALSVSAGASSTQAPIPEASAATAPSPSPTTPDRTGVAATSTAEPEAAPAPKPSPLATPGAIATVTSPRAPALTLASADDIRYPPVRDLDDLTSRLRPPAPTEQPSTHGPFKVGDRYTFWVIDQNSKKAFQMPAHVAYVTDHVYMYLADGSSASQQGLAASAQTFEQKSYPRIHAAFGSEPNPGIDGDPHITVLNGPISGVAGYFSSLDAYRRDVNQYSNEREMVYMNVAAVTPGSVEYDAVLAHEFTHMVQFNVSNGGDTWVHEGTAEVGAEAAGFPSGSGAVAYRPNPDLSLTEWSETPTGSFAHYGAAFLFFDYFAQHHGGYPAVGKLMAVGARGLASVDAYLSAQGISPRFNDIFRQWLVANVVDDCQIPPGLYCYKDTSFHVQTAPVTSYPFDKSDTVNQFGADYYDFTSARGNLTIAFDGQKSGRLVGPDPNGQTEWWSNRGDTVDSRLTRRVDLTKVSKATLRFSIWYDIEQDYDYGYAEVSTDGGSHWTTLAGRHTTTSNPNGGSYGNGYTGRSGGSATAGGSQGETNPFSSAQPRSSSERPIAQWLEDEIDLTPYAGREILLRFEYVTDDAFNSEGFGIDDVSIPEIGWQDDAESDGDWQAEGFTRIANEIPLRYSVQVVSVKSGANTTVQLMNLDENNHGQIVVPGVGAGGDVQRVIVIVAGETRVTRLPSPYEIRVTEG